MNGLIFFLEKSAQFFRRGQNPCKNKGLKQKWPHGAAYREKNMKKLINKEMLMSGVKLMAALLVYDRVVAPAASNLIAKVKGGK